MPQTFNDQVEITGQGNQVLELTCTGDPRSQTRLMAVNSNRRLEGQIQFVGQFSITGIPGTPSNRDGNQERLTYEPGILTLFLPHSVEGIKLETGSGGDVKLFHPNGGHPHIELIANETTIANTGGGLVNVTDGGGNTTIRLNGHRGTIEAPVLQTTGSKAILRGDNGGFVQLFHPNGGHPHIELIANETTIANTGGGLVNITDGGGNTTIRLNGHAGTIEASDIILTQADCAEDFDLAAGEMAEPGSVMVIDQEGALKESHGAYDRKVAGVISGAGDYKASVTLDRQSPARTGRMPIALSGKVYCKVDASYNPIEVGDLLVTSPTRAHAMKANDPMRAFGAVIGKALRGLESGRGLLPILVSLQ
jgi:hypothetical protein